MSGITTPEFEKFELCIQKEHDTITTYANLLQLYAGACSSIDDQVVLKQFIKGLRSDTIKESLNEQIGSLTFARAFFIASSMEKKDETINIQPQSQDSAPIMKKRKSTIVFQGPIKADLFVVGTSHAVIHNDHESGQRLPTVGVPNRTEGFERVERSITIEKDVQTKQAFIDDDDVTVVNNRIDPTPTVNSDTTIPKTVYD